MGEQWKPVRGYVGHYEVSNMGRVASLPRRLRYGTKNGGFAFRTTKRKVICENRINSGYLIVHLYRHNQRKAFLIHRLVMAAFDSSSTLEVNHKDGDKSNNQLANLEYLSSKENHQHAADVGLNPSVRPVECIDIKTRKVTKFPSMSDAARRLGKPNAGTKISAVVNGKRKSAYGFFWRLADG